MLAFIKSKSFISLGLVALLFSAFFLAKELDKRYQINRQIADLQRQIAYYQSKNDQALKLIQYFQTTEYQERQARQLLNLQKPGEFAVALPPSAEDASSSAAAATAAPAGGNFRLWWDYFFGPK